MCNKEVKFVGDKNISVVKMHGATIKITATCFSFNIPSSGNLQLRYVIIML